MTVGALIDAGANWDGLQSALHSLGLGAAFRVERTKRKGIGASKFFVEYAAEKQQHRHLPQVEKIIDAGDLSQSARANALAIFRKLGEAESKAHAVPVEKVHFHEVGAVDSICDIVGACVALDLLEVSAVHCSRVNVGSGTVNTEHGPLPVPTPATAELLKDKPIYSSGPETELTTPTGAAILSTLSKSFGPVPPMQVQSQGFGAGDKDFRSQANVLRVLIGQRRQASEATSVDVLEANIDDTTPQVLGYAMERLLEAGALDVTFTPIFMKKNRPATLLSVVSAPELSELLTEIIFSETTTLGLRVHQADRRVLSRSLAEVETRYGNVRVKYTSAGGFTPEYDDCRSRAEAHKVPLRTVIAEATQAFRKLHF